MPTGEFMNNYFALLSKVVGSAGCHRAIFRPASNVTAAEKVTVIAEVWNSDFLILNRAPVVGLELVQKWQKTRDGWNG